ncbi:PepSY domain-containing protein [Pseudotabrizicola sp. 4114]|uniref:PepSY domain-containing protein n=1 Tax=Pseudotabrizicola sp. 4114 TaxID=2817731 RepID=UPI002864F60C|nr:hypothetical protein [Pseudorhodobacter sp. 4114]
MKLSPLAPALAVLTLALPSVAQAAPPADARPLSEVITTLEASGDVAWIDEIDWDDDGYWEIEYYRADGGKVQIKIDPVTGSPRS